MCVFNNVVKLLTMFVILSFVFLTIASFIWYLTTKNTIVRGIWPNWPLNKGYYKCRQHKQLLCYNPSNEC